MCFVVVITLGDYNGVKDAKRKGRSDSNCMREVLGIRFNTLHQQYRSTIEQNFQNQLGLIIPLCLSLLIPKIGLVGLEEWHSDIEPLSCKH